MNSCHPAVLETPIEMQRIISGHLHHCQEAALTDPQTHTTLGGWGWQGALTSEYPQRQRPHNLPGKAVPVTVLRWSLLCFRLCPWPLFLPLSTADQSASADSRSLSVLFALPSLYTKCGCIPLRSQNVFLICFIYGISRELVSFQMLKIQRY